MVGFLRVFESHAVTISLAQRHSVGPSSLRDPQDSDDIDSNAEDHNYDEIRYRLLNHRRSIEMVKLPRGSVKFSSETTRSLPIRMLSSGSHARHLLETKNDAGRG